MKIQFVSKINCNQIAHIKKQVYISTPATIKNITNLKNFPNYAYQVNFKGTDAETINKMQKLIKSKNYNFEDLVILFNKLSDKKKQNVNGTVEKFEKEGLTSDDYLRACIKHPSLFYRLPETIENNVRGLTKRFEKEGLTSDDYIKACIKQPPLFYLSPETIENNVRELIKQFEKEGLTSDDYIKTCIKRPSLFCLSPKTVAEHINSYMFIDKNNLGYKDKNIIKKVLHKNIVLSTSLIYLQGIVFPQLKKQNSEIRKWSKYGLKPKLKEFFKNNSNEKFTIKIINDEMSNNFIKTIKEYCKKDFGKDDMFDIIIQ